ncbi:MAG: 30S ribosomal protein S30e [Desulfobacterales bacterium]|nr:30S ribosomal protein S30e [Desulfobacterales bacterium]
MSRVKRSGRGTHGSIAKAGKVREQTPKVQPSSKKRSPGPLVSNRRSYLKSLSLKPWQRHRRR